MGGLSLDLLPLRDRGRLKIHSMDLHTGQEDPMGRKQTAARVAKSRSSAAKWGRVRFKDNREESTKGGVTGAYNRCWCGEPSGHWQGPGPHPR